MSISERKGCDLWEQRSSGGGCCVLQGGERSSFFFPPFLSAMHSAPHFSSERDRPVRGEKKARHFTSVGRHRSPSQRARSRPIAGTNGSCFGVRWRRHIGAPRARNGPEVDLTEKREERAPCEEAGRRALQWETKRSLRSDTAHPSIRPDSHMRACNSHQPPPSAMIEFPSKKHQQQGSIALFFFLAEADLASSSSSFVADHLQIIDFATALFPL